MWRNGTWVFEHQVRGFEEVLGADLIWMKGL